jgi:hypothetical protein
MHGCASVSGSQQLTKENEKTVASNITKDVTTKADVRAKYDFPLKIDFTDNGLETWTYEAEINELKDFFRFDKLISLLPLISWFGSINSGIKKELVFYFNENGTVEDYSMNISDFQKGSGIFDKKWAKNNYPIYE